MEKLTKENFWDEMEQNYPKAMAHFKTWIDKYKSEHKWNDLFNEDPHFTTTGYRGAPKYHELPIAMQFGIFIEYTFFAIEDIKLKVKGIDIAQNRPFIEGVRFGIDKALDYINSQL